MSDAPSKPLKSYAACKCVKCGAEFSVCDCAMHRACGPPGVGCGAPMWFVTTEAGKKMPLNEDGTSHFQTCPKANNF